MNAWFFLFLKEIINWGCGEILVADELAFDVSLMVQAVNDFGHCSFREYFEMGHVFDEVDQFLFELFPDSFETLWVIVGMNHTEARVYFCSDSGGSESTLCLESKLTETISLYQGCNLSELGFFVSHIDFLHEVLRL